MTRPRPQTGRICEVSLCEGLEDRKLFASALAYGINVNKIDSSTYNHTVKMLRDTGTKTVRVWYGINSWGERKEAGIVKYIRRLHEDGFDVMVAVVPPNGKPGTVSEVKGLFNYLVNLPGMKAAVDRWQVGNEPDHKQYWNGTLQAYVTNFLAPASEVLRAAGEKVVSAGPSWNPADVKKMVDAGMLKYVDYVGYHPYRSTLADLKSKVAEVKSIVGGKPLIASEWNIRGRENNTTSWNQGIKEFWPVIRDNFYAAYYYAAIKSTTMAGAAGVINTNGTPNGAFYNTYKSLNSGNSNSQPITETVKSGSSPSTTTTTPSKTVTSTGGTATITGRLFWDSNQNGKLDGKEVGQAGKTVFIDLNGNGKLDANEKSVVTDANGYFTFTGVAAGTYQIRRVVPKGYKVTTGAYESVTVKAGQTFSNVLIGTYNA